MQGGRRVGLGSGHYTSVKTQTAIMGPLIPYKQSCLLLQSPLRTCTVRNGGHYLLCQYDMNSQLAANVKCEVWQYHKKS